jgi:hypothetical protein
LDNYFPEGFLHIFEVLNPSRLPTDVTSVPNYVNEINSLALRFNENAEVVERQFSDALLSMISNNYNIYCSAKADGNALTFWTYFLDSILIAWGENFKRLLHIVLSLPFGSADVERGFSVLHNFMIKSRSRLTPKHMEDIARIKINGPSITDFDASLYTLHWLSSNHIDADNNRSTRNSKVPDDDQRRSALF